MIVRTGLAVAAWATSATAALAAPIVLTPGEFVTVERAASGDWHVVDRGLAALDPESDLEQTAVDFLAGSRPAMTDAPPVFMSGNPGPKPKFRPNAIRFVLRRVRGRESLMLVIENGYDLVLRYQAAFQKNGRQEPTSVCDVLTGSRPAFEYWPFSFERLSLDELKLLPQSDAISCA